MPLSDIGNLNFAKKKSVMLSKDDFQMMKEWVEVLDMQDSELPGMNQLKTKLELCLCAFIQLKLFRTNLIKVLAFLIWSQTERQTEDRQKTESTYSSVNSSDIFSMAFAEKNAR